MIEWIATILSVIGVILNAHQNKISWPVWLIANCFWMYIFFVNKQWGAFTTFTAYQICNIYGWYMWKKKERNN